MSLICICLVASFCRKLISNLRLKYFLGLVLTSFWRHTLAIYIQLHVSRIQRWPCQGRYGGPTLSVVPNSSLMWWRGSQLWSNPLQRMLTTLGFIYISHFDAFRDSPQHPVFFWYIHIYMYMTLAIQGHMDRDTPLIKYMCIVILFCYVHITTSMTFALHGHMDRDTPLYKHMCIFVHLIIILRAYYNSITFALQGRMDWTFL